MRSLSVLAAIVVALLVCVSTGSAGETSAESVTSVPTPWPTAPGTASSTITLRHLYRGVPVVVFVDHRFSRGIVDGRVCGWGHSADVQGVAAIVSEVWWPWSENAPCNWLGLPAHICSGANNCSEEFVFEGEDLTVDFNWREDSFGGAPFATAHFRQDGAPVQVTITNFDLGQGDDPCLSASWPAFWPDTPPATLSDLSHDIGAICLEAGAVRAKFTTVEFGELEATFTWNGGDVSYDVIIPSALTPTPVPTPTATPAALPRAGGSPTNGVTPASAMIIGAIALFAGALILSRRYATRTR